MPVHVLGISAYYHDSAAALLSDGQVVAAAQQERFSRVKNDPRFPFDAIRYCLASQSLTLSDLKCVVFFEHPWRKFSRLLATYIGFAPKGGESFVRAMSSWLPRKLFLRREIVRELSRLEGLGGDCASRTQIAFGHHHRSHAASAFFSSPFKRAAVLCMDGVGEWETTSAWFGENNRLTHLWKIDFPHSLGLLYSTFTQYMGFRVNSGEYKLMGLAPYGRPLYVDRILDNLVDIKPDGTFRLDLSYFDYPTGFQMVSSRFEELFGGPCREPESPITQRHMDLAHSIQVVTEMVVTRLASTIYHETRAEYLCLAGGVALNCVANGELLRKGLFRDIWIQPAAGDAGGALGAALSMWHEALGQPRDVHGATVDSMRGSFLGPSFSATEVCRELDGIGAKYEIMEEENLIERVSQLIANGNVVAWFKGRMEFGPRALGARSILGDPRNPRMQSLMNLKIKFRESFRPFAPAVLEEAVSDYFELDRPSPYMLMVAAVHPRLRVNESETDLLGIERLQVQRSAIPAVTHVDYSARVQTVNAKTNPTFHALLKKFFDHTGCPVLINTSFNVRGEPIVCTPRDAFRCFMRSNIDFLVVENCLLEKRNQLAMEDDPSWRLQHTLD